ncbi:MAG: 30S ribosomal protein S4 [Candidatus Thermoplasmatota archaeon]
MGDPKFSRKKYETPFHPWQKDRMVEEDELCYRYGLKNKKEVWKAESLLRKWRRHARDLQAKLGTEEAKKEMALFLRKLYQLGIVEENAVLDDVLALDIEKVLGRRLQTVAYLSGLAYTLSQARQLIVHGHIGIGGRKINIPSYLVRRGEIVEYVSKSPLKNEAHLSRPPPEFKPELPKKRLKEEEEKIEKIVAKVQPREEEME